MDTIFFSKDKIWQIRGRQNTCYFYSKEQVFFKINILTHGLGSILSFDVIIEIWWQPEEILYIFS